MAGDQDDPFLWDADRLAQEFSSSRLSSILTPGRKLPDLNNLAAKIREQELDGQTLLTYEDELGIAGLWEDLDIKKAPHKLSVNELIRHLKKRSPKYDEWKISLHDGFTNPSRPNEESPEHVFGKVPAPAFASTPNGAISGQSDISSEPCPPTNVPPVSPGVGSLLPATLPGPSGEDMMANLRADSPTLNGSVKKRKIAPIFVSSTPNSSQYTAPFGVPTFADILTVGRTLDAFSTPFSGSPGYLGPTTLYPDRITQPPVAGSLEEVDDEREFSWVKSKVIPPGRSVQVSKRMNRFLRIGTFVKNPLDAESETDSVVPFGESGDEQEYDSELEQELDEVAEKMEREKSSRSHLAPDVAKEVIDNAIRSLRIKWTEKKKPIRDRTAWGIWQKARREGNRRLKIEREEARVKALDGRIAVLTNEIVNTGWVHGDVLLDKASSWLDLSVSDQMESQWLIRLLQSHQPPPKPAKLPKLKLKPKKKPVDLGEDEEVLTDDEFVIDDDDNGDGDPMEVDSNHYPDDDIPLADGLERAASPAEPIDVDPRETPDRVLKSESKKPILNTPQKPMSYSDVIEIQSTPMKKLDQMPDLEDFETIGEIGMAYWTEFKDRERLLVAILFEQSPIWRSDVYNLISEHKPSQIWDSRIEKQIAAGLKSTPVLSAVEFELAKLFNAFHTVTHNRMHLTKFPTVTWHKYQGLRSEFVRFCDFLKSIMPRFLAPLTPRTPTSTSLALSPVSDMEMEGQVDNAGEGSDDDRSTANSTLDDAEPVETDDASEAMYEDSDSLSESPEDVMPLPSSSGKKKRPLRRDKKAQEIRDATLKQTEEFEKRRKQLRDRLAQTGSIPSDKTRLIVNETKKSDEQALIYINQSIGRKIKDHQIEGVRFMWNLLTVDSKAQSGGLLAHSMGLGKTMQVITLLVVIAESARSLDPSIRSQIPKHLVESKTLIICPAGLVENWIDELLAWAPKDLLGELFKVVAKMPEKSRPGVIRKWASNGGVLVIGITLYGKIDKDGGELARILAESPSIVICDEAHMLKNPKSGRHKATGKFTTRSRIALTGSPLTKGVGDYYHMIDWVAPGYLADYAEFAQRFETPITAGLYMDSDKYAQRKARKQLHVLKALVEPKVHRIDVDVLRHELPKKMEFILTVRLTPMQMRTYETYLNADNTLGRDRGWADLWSFVANMSRLVAHPRIFKIDLEKKKKDREKEAARTKRAKALGEESPPITVDRVLPGRHLGDVLATLANREIEEHAQSNKMELLIGILDECKRLGEKVLVFSQALDTLDYLVNMFSAQGRVYQRLDGSTNMAERQNAIKKFNSDDSIEVYLISTKAGGVGFNIYGASRVVIFDVKWTPAEEQQAIGRSYRIGQTKPVYVYWLTVGGTFEDSVHNIAIFKAQLASRVVDKKNPLPRSRMIQAAFTEPTIPEKQDLSKTHRMDPVLDSLVRRFGNPNDDDCILRNVTFTETFEEEEVFELTAEDKLEAEQAIEAERLRITDPDEYKRREQEKWAGMRPEPGTAQSGGPQPNSPTIPPHLRTNLKQATVNPNSAAGLEEGAGSSSLGGSAVAGVAGEAGVAGLQGPAVTANQNMVPDILPNIRPVNEPPPSTAPVPGLVRGCGLVSPDRVFGSRALPSTQVPAASGKLEWYGIIQPQSPGSPKRGNPILGVAKKPLAPMLGKHTQYKETPVPLPRIPPVAPPSPANLPPLGENELQVLLGSLSTRTKHLLKTGHKPLLTPKQLVAAVNNAMESQKIEGLPRMDKVQNLEKHVRENPRFADAVLSGHLKIRSTIDMDRSSLDRKSKDYTSMSEADFENAVWKIQGSPEQKTTTPVSSTKTRVQRNVDLANGNVRGSPQTVTTARHVKQELLPQKSQTPTRGRPSTRRGDTAESPQVID